MASTSRPRALATTGEAARRRDPAHRHPVTAAFTLMGRLACRAVASAAPKRRHVQSAFTLIELLVVVAIISILASMLLPALGRARDMGRRVLCLTNQKNLYMYAVLYTEEQDDWVPPGSMAQTPAVNVSNFILHPATFGGGRSTANVVFYQDYLKVQINPAGNRITDPRGIVWCPSGNRTGVAFADAWGRQGYGCFVDYRMPGLSAYSIDVPFALTRTARLWEKGQHGVRAFSFDASAALPDGTAAGNLFYERTPHKGGSRCQGVNLITVEGSGAWVSAAECNVRPNGLDPYWYNTHLVPRAYEIVAYGNHPHNMRDGYSNVPIANINIYVFRNGLPSWQPAGTFGYTR